MHKHQSGTDSEGEKRQRMLTSGDEEWAGPNLWTGIGRARRGIGQSPADLLECCKRRARARVVRAIREEQHEHITIRINPERRPGPAGMSVAVWAEQRAGAGNLFARG